MAAVEGPRLDDQLCFAVYAASNTIVRAYRPLLARIGLTYPQYLVMMVLWEQDGPSIAQVATRLDQPAHGLTPVLRRLVDAGLITRAIDESDRRAVRLLLTEDGRRLGRDAGAVQSDVACRAGLDSGAYDALRDTLQLLTRTTATDAAVDAGAAVAPAREAETPSESFDTGLLRSATVAAYVIDADGAIEAVSPAASTLLHWPADDLVGRSAHNALHHSDDRGVPASATTCAIQAARQGDRVARAEHDTFWRGDGAPVPVWWTAVPVIDEQEGRHRTVVVFDRLSTEAATASDDEHTDADTRLLVLGQLSELLGINDVAEGLQRVAALGASTLADWCVIDRVDDEGVTRAAIADRRSEQADLDARLQVMPRVTAASVGSLGRVLRGADTVAVDFFVDDTPFLGVSSDALDVAQAGLFADLGAAHAFVVPLRARNKVLGAMTWVRKDPTRPFTDTDVLLATVFGFRVGLWLDNARLYGQQQRMSETLQRSLLTSLPEPDHLHVVARYAPASEGVEVGGDWYDAILTTEGRLAITIGDVTGHDTEAAARMSQLRSMTRFALLDAADPDTVLGRVDAAMPALAIHGQATAVVAVISQDERQRPTSHRTVTWANAGHLPPLLIGPDGAARLLDTSPDLMLGVRAGTPRTAYHREIDPGSTLVLYTDGLVERRGEVLDVGLDRLVHAAGETAHLSPDDLCDELLARLAPHDSRSDDIAIIAVRFNPEEQPRPPEAGPEVLPGDMRSDVP